MQRMWGTLVTPLPYLRAPPQIKPPPLLPGERPDLPVDRGEIARYFLIKGSRADFLHEVCPYFGEMPIVGAEP